MLSKLVPKFVKEGEVVRLEGNYVRPAAADFETNFVSVLRLWLFKTYLEDASHIYEFGCGTGHNLAALAELFPDKAIRGADWTDSSRQILSLLREHHGYDISGDVFDMLAPDDTYQLESNSAVFTIGTMEQLGQEFEPFLQYLLSESPRVCINVETVYELYDQENLFDYVAGSYLCKRGYLRGYLPRLRELEHLGKIRILQARRTFGSLYHDGYSFVVWEPAG